MKPSHVLVLAMIFLFIILIGVFLFIRIDSSNFQDGDGLSASQKIGVVYMALSNIGLDGVLYSPGNCYINNVIPMKPGYQYGFINATGKLAEVRVQLGSFPRLNRAFFVNLSDNTLQGTEDSSYRDGFPFAASITMPPGAIWYHRIWGMSEQGGIFYSCSVNVTDSGQYLYPLVLNSSELEKFKKGLSYTALEYKDSSTGKMRIYDGSIPITSFWMPNITSNYSSTIYLVLKNNEDKPVEVNAWS